MEYTPVLNVYTIAYADGIYIAAKYGVKPNAAIATDGNIANDGCIFG